MSGNVRLTICAAVATLASACALLPLVTPADWLMQAAWLIIVQSAVGALARRSALPGVLTAGIQLLVSLLLLTWVFVRDQAVAGVLPGPAAFRELELLLVQGTADVAEYAIPAPMTDGIRLMLVAGVLLIGLVVDVLAVTCRSAAPAGLPLLALYSVAAGLSQGGIRWLWFLCAAAGYLLLLLAEGRERLSQWGRLFGPGSAPPGTPDPAASGPRPAPGSERTPAALRTGRRIGVLTLGIALVVPAALPSLDSGLLDTAGGSGRGPGNSSAVSAVNPLVALQDSLNQPDNRTVLTYTTDAGGAQDLYLRIVALDQFDGAAWRPSERRITDVPQPLPPPPGLAPDVATTSVTTRVAAADWYVQSWLPMPYPASRVEIDGRWRFEPEGRTLVGDRGQSTRGARYEVQSLVVQPTADQLANAPQPTPKLLEEYTWVPESLPATVQQTALDVTHGARNDYERAVRLQDWFTRNGGFTYDSTVQAGTGTTAIVNFLKQREGFCVHFSFSMAAMSRTLGIPARVAVGFTPGTRQSDGRTEVGLQDAHAWPELYFEGIGWTRFEPTPSRGTPPEYTVPEATDRDPGVDEPLPGTDASRSPGAEPSQSAQCTPQPGQQSGCTDAGAAPAGGGTGGGDFPWQPVLGTSAVVLLLLIVPLLPLLWRIRVRAGRLGSGTRTGRAANLPAAPHDEEGAAGPGGAPTGASHRTRALAAWRELTDSGWDYGIVPDESATPRSAVARIIARGKLDAEAAGAAHRVAQAVEQVLYAPEPRPAAGLAEDVRRVRAGLGASAGRARRIRALLLPRSAVQVVWAVSERQAAAARWCNGILRRAAAALRPSRQRA